MLQRTSQNSMLTLRNFIYNPNWYLNSGSEKFYCPSQGDENFVSGVACEEMHTQHNTPQLVHTE